MSQPTEWFEAPHVEYAPLDPFSGTIAFPNEHTTDETISPPDSPTDFYEVGKTYDNPTTEWLFRVDCITQNPEDGGRTALGWRYWDGAWEPYAYEEGDWEIYQQSRRLCDGR